MTMTDPIADMLTRIRNANRAFHETVTMPHSNIKVGVAEILKREGYIASFDMTDDAVGRTLSRIAHEIIEGNPDLDDLALVGIQTRGVPLAQRLARLIEERAGVAPALGAEVHAHYLHFYRNFSPEDYARLVNNSRCIVGNSSSGLREGAFLGVPCVNVGSRQSGRERAANVRLAGQARRLREDPTAIEEVARRELGLIRPGEKVFIIKDVPPPGAKH